MSKTFISVRDVDEEVFRKFRAMTIEEKIKLGEAVTRAMKVLLEEVRENKRKKLKSVGVLLKIKPRDFGPGTESLSMEVDEVLYGKK